MTNKIEGYIGCPTHGAMFRLESQRADRASVFQNVKIALEGVETPLDAKICPAENCGKVLQRVPAPE